MIVLPWIKCLPKFSHALINMVNIIKNISIKIGTSLYVSNVFLLLTAVHQSSNAAEVIPFQPVSEVKEFNILTTAIASTEEIIWIGTLNGLAYVRPGEQNIFNIATGHTVANHVSRIAIDKKGAIWASLIEGGIFYFNQGQNEYYHLQDRYDLDELDCHDLVLNKAEHELLMACDKALYSLHIPTQEFNQLNAIDSVDKQFENYYSVSFAADDHLLIGTWKEGLFLLNRDTMIVKNVGLKELNIHRIERITDTLFHVSTNSGVYSFDQNANVIKKLGGGFYDAKLDTEALQTVSIDVNRHIFAFATHGVYEFEASKNELFSSIVLPPVLDLETIGIINRIKTIQNNHALGVGADNSGFYVLPLKFGFTSFIDMSVLLHSNISMIQELDSKVFIGDQSNLLLLDDSKHALVSFSEKVGYIYFILNYQGGYLVSTYESGFVTIDKKGNIIERNIKFEGLPTAPDSRFSEILSTSDNQYLLGTDQGSVEGLFSGNFQKGFQQIYESGTIIEIIDVKSDTAVIDKALTVTPYDGLLVYNFNMKKFTHFKPDVEGQRIDCAEKLSDSLLFLCVRRNQAQIFDLDKKQFSQFLPDKPELRNVRDAELDKNGLLWITTSSGLFVYDDEQDLTRISVSEGVRSKEFSIDGILNLTDTLIIPGNRGIVEIDVDKAKEFLAFKKSQENKAFITKFDVVLDDETDDQGSLIKDLANPVSLPHTNVITRLQFSHDNFLEMEGLAFDVRMIGLNDKWSTLDVGEYTSTYTSLQPGDYEFQVRVNDPRSRALQPVEKIRITVLPPWWKTNGAYVSYFISLVLAFYFVAWFRNKTLIKQNKMLSEKVSERTITIRRLLEQKQTFFANVSHEFRTPLSLIMGPLDAISDKLTGQSDKQNISIMRRNTNRLMRLVDQILELAKFETSQSLPKQVYEVKASMQIIAASFSSLLEIKQQKLILKNIDDVRLLLVEDSFEMIMTNLISNAIKYCPRGAEMSISMSAVDKFLVLVVADNGDGIAPENLDVLFERFTRFDGAENVQGSGIGLALVKQLVLSNGGKIDVVSQQGEGTEFTIKLPLNVSFETKVTRVTNIQVLDSELFNDDEHQSDTNLDDENKEMVIASDESESQKTSQKYRLLVVEDNADLRTYIKNCLQDDYDLDMAINGQEGLKKAQNSIPDLILSDVLMPIMDGYELANAIRTDDATSHIPIVLLTAKGDDLSRMKGWEEQVDDYLTKPFKVKELKARITRLLSIRDILRKKHTSEISNSLATKNKQIISFQTKRDKEFFVRFEKLIDKRYCDEHFSRSEAASNLALSERQLNRKLAALVDYNFSEYLRRYRLQKSAELLVSGHQVTQVAYDVGFGSPSYFSSCFKAEFGKTPRNYAEEGLETNNVVSAEEVVN